MKPAVPVSSEDSTTPPPTAVTVNQPSGNANHIAGSSHSIETYLPGQQFGDFRLVRCLGQGGMGQVFLADQLSLQRRVAIKFLRRDHAENETFLKRFEAEAKAIAQLTHPNIVQVYSVGSEQGTRYMALEYVEGTNLKDYLNRKGPPEITIALAIMRQITSALVKAAELGIIHRDIKPENILITRKVEVKVADFGLSRMVGDEVHLTQSGTTMGTPLYMSPEQILGKPVDTRTDLYSLGTTCYHLLTGQPPFLAESAMAVGVRHLTDAAQPIQELRPDLPAELCSLVHRLLAKQPEDRPQSAREVLRELRRIQDKLAGNTAAESDTYQAEVETLPDPAAVSAFTGSSSSRLASVNRGKLRWLMPVVGGSVMLAIIGGAIIGFVLRSDNAVATKASTAASTAVSDPKKILNASLLELEQKLLKRVEETKYQRNPDNPLEFPLEKMQQGLRVRAELMKFYVLNLDDTHDRARQFADKEARAVQAPEPYRAIGYIGMAVLLATEGKTKASNDALEQALTQRNSANPKRILQNQMLRNRDIAELIQMTLKMNEAAMPLPASLAALKEEMARFERNNQPDKLKTNK
ncbi:MAG: serine/threonine protein kinase [Planctomycetia bacterium]|nr:serine/threonine protein kinase [Planctomycetia bacterium]